MACRGKISNQTARRWFIKMNSGFRWTANLLVCILLVFQYALITLMKTEDCGKITNDWTGNRDIEKVAVISDTSFSSIRLMYSNKDCKRTRGSCVRTYTCTHSLKWHVALYLNTLRIFVHANQVNASYYGILPTHTHTHAQLSSQREKVSILMALLPVVIAFLVSCAN